MRGIILAEKFGAVRKMKGSPIFYSYIYSYEKPSSILEITQEVYA